MLERNAISTSKPAGSGLVAVIGALATLIGAVVGLLSLFHTLGWVGSKTPQPAPAAVAAPGGPTAADMAALQMQLRAVQSQLASTSMKASALSQAQSPAASAAAATRQLFRAKESAAAVDKKLSQLQSPSTQMKPEERNAEFEVIKNEMDKLADMQRSLSGVLNTMDEQAKGAIRHMRSD